MAKGRELKSLEEIEEAALNPKLLLLDSIARRFV